MPASSHQSRYYQTAIAQQGLAPLGQMITATGKPQPLQIKTSAQVLRISSTNAKLAQQRHA
jgi:hypothetical protein